MPVLIVVPQANELDALLSGFRDTGVVISDTRIGNINGHRIEELQAVVAEAGHGKAQFAATTSYLLCNFSDAELVICTGAAGALLPDITLGELIVSTVTVEHDYRVRFAPQSLPRHPGDAKSLSELQRTVAISELAFTVRFGVVASGDEDIVDERRGKELREDTGAICVAWEGSGGARAAKLHSKKFVEIRAITDGSNDSAANDFHTNLGIAMPNTAKLLVTWLSH